MSITDSGYAPQNPTGVIGGIVQWSNQGPSQHTVTDKSGMGFFDSGAMAVGATFMQTLAVTSTCYFLDTLNLYLVESMDEVVILALDGTIVPLAAKEKLPQPEKVIGGDEPPITH